MTVPLWPQPIPILGVTGEYQSGKTFFAISICPDPRRLRVYDLEMSATPYASLGFDHINVPQVMTARHPNGFKPVDLWNWWLADVSALESGRYDAIVVDPITDLERGLTDWVQANPGHFGHTAPQYQAMSGIMWGDVKDYWKLILTSRVATKCQTFAFVAHLGDEVKNKQFTGGRVPKGKDTLIETASLYLYLERDKTKNAGKPAARVLKSRLSHLSMGDDGPEIRDALPPRLPVATPRALRDYLRNPPDLANLKPEETIAERELSADERLRLEVQRAEAMRDAALAQQQPRQPAVTAPSPPPPTAPVDPSATLRDTFRREIIAAGDGETLSLIGERIKAAKADKTLSEVHAKELADPFRAKQKGFADAAKKS